MLNQTIKLLTSIRLTVVCLGLATVLVFIGTLAQVDEGLYQAQARYFKSWLITRPLNWPIVYPGGYLIGTVLLVNLLCAHAKRFQLTRKKIGLVMIHAGIVLLLLGQMLTDMLSEESAMRLTEGQARNYSESFRHNELALVDTSDPQTDGVIAIPETMLTRGEDIHVPQTPFTLRVKHHWPNSELSVQPAPMATKADATQGLGAKGIYVFAMPPVTKSEDRNVPTAIVEILSPQGSLGSWVVSPHLIPTQSFSFENKTYNLALRFTRRYKPFYLELIKFTHEKYPGTEIPKNYASRVLITRPETGESREVLIYMNNPLRYHGETFYQADFDKRNDQLLHKVSILQVVHNPSWLTPYFSCALVGLGLLVQFLSHLVSFTSRFSR